MKLEKNFPATYAAYPEIAAWVEDELSKLDCPQKIIMQISMCLEEAFINIAHYAYGDKTGSMDLIFEYDNSIVTLCLKDKGVAFDPLAKQDPDVTLGIDERKIGGLGIFLVKEMMDEVHYQRLNNENVLTFSKKIK